MIFKRFYSVFNPALYHGWGKSRKFFEGWYYKIVSKNQKYAFAIIPGIAMDENGKKQSFIQLLDGKELNAKYYKFDFDKFTPSNYIHDVKIDNSRFTENFIEIDIPNFSGKLFFEKVITWPNSIFSPGIMGPFSFIPFMECYHGILSMNHTVKGKITYNNKIIDFNQGKGYIEKDWGHSFPRGYIWMQCNNFADSSISIKASIAKIPWLNSSFIGFIAGVSIGKKLFQFTTYNFSKIIKCNLENKKVELIIENSRYILIIYTLTNLSTELIAPIRGYMDSRIEETMNGNIEFIIKEKKSNKIICQNKGTSAAIEIAGEYKVLLK